MRLLEIPMGKNDLKLIAFVFLALLCLLAQHARRGAGGQGCVSGHGSGGCVFDR
jgi:hypothetical protein